MQGVDLTFISYCTLYHTRACRSYEQRCLLAATDDADDSLAGFTQCKKNGFIGGVVSTSSQTRKTKKVTVRNSILQLALIEVSVKKTSDFSARVFN